MVIDKKCPEDEIAGKLQRLIDYTRSLYGQSYGEGFEGGLNRMAKVVIFNINFTSLVKELDRVQMPFTEVQAAHIIRHLNFMIDMSNSADEAWACLWEGRHPLFKLEDYSVLLKENGVDVTKSLADLKKITILE